MCEIFPNFTCHLIIEATFKPQHMIFVAVGSCSFDPVKKELVWDVSFFSIPSKVFVNSFAMPIR